MQRLTLRASLLFTCLALPLSLQAKPNIVVILADDMGYGDVQALNPASAIPTPHLNALARSGANFVDAHSGSAVCTPTRYGLLTGRYCWRSRLKRGVLFPPRDKPLIEDDRPTIASYLKGQGYRTAMVGKWHLGIEWARDNQGKVVFDAPFTNGPVEKGFETWFGIAASLDMVPYVYLRDHQAVAKCTTTQKAIGFPKYVREGPRDPNFDPGDVLDDLARESAAFIQRATMPSGAGSATRNKPYFLYVPLTGPHKPVWPHKRFVGKTRLGPYGDFIHQVDHTVGVILTAIEKSGQAGNTIIIYTSDNGSFMYRRGDEQNHHLADEKDQGYRPSDHSANHHWRGTKADVWEGGHRVPFFVRWPDQIKPRQVTRVTCHTDIFATLAEAVGQPLPAGAAEDSFSFLPAARGKPSGKARPGVINHSAAGVFAIRSGPWKLVAGSGSGGRQQPKGKPFQKPYHLYNLDEDPGETRDLIESKPGIAARLEEELTRIRGAK